MVGRWVGERRKRWVGGWETITKCSARWRAKGSLRRRRRGGWVGGWVGGTYHHEVFG